MVNTNALIFLGTGVSTGLPQIGCVLPSAKERCAVCHDGLENENSPNRRCNVSALLRLNNRNILIDCGKTMRESSLRYFPKFGVGGIDAIVLTHGHADAYLGLDDVRDFQLRDRSEPTPVYLNDETHKVCKRVFPYLFTEGDRKPGQEVDVSRRVALIDWRVIHDPFVKFDPLPGVDVSFTPIPLLHGGEYICWGYVIEVGAHNAMDNRFVIAYLSDVHEIPERSMAFLKSLGHIDVLVIDALSLTKRHVSHFSLEQAKELALSLRPEVTRCVGMGCRIGDHHLVNRELSKLRITEGIDFLLAHDGLKISLNR